MQPGAAPADPGPVRLDAELSVEPSGNVGAIELHGEAPDPLRRCLDSAIRNWRFPSAKAPTSVRFPMVFQPNIVR
jgi:hypothetical protein